MAAEILTSGISGSVQVYFEKKWMDQKRRSYDTPLANSKLGVKASIPKHGGAYAEFRKFEDYTVPSVTADDAPKYYSESDGDPSSGQTETARIIQVPLAELRDYVSMGNMVRSVDPIDVVKASYQKFETQIRRWVHQHVNECFVNGIADTNSYTGGSNLASNFNTMYAGGANNFADLTAGSKFTVEDFKKAKVALANDGVPEVYPGLHVAVIDHAICSQLEADPYFRELVIRGYKTDKVFGGAKAIDIYGLRFIIQHDPYRCNLPGAGGLLATRANTGAVHVAHVMGKDAFGYVDLGDARTRSRLMRGTGFKVQDVTKTGVELTIGYNIPFKAAVLQENYGLNIAGTTDYDVTVSSFA